MSSAAMTLLTSSEIFPPVKMGAISWRIAARTNQAPMSSHVSSGKCISADRQAASARAISLREASALLGSFKNENPSTTMSVVVLERSLLDIGTQFRLRRATRLSNKIERFIFATRAALSTSTSNMNFRPVPRLAPTINLRACLSASLLLRLASALATSEPLVGTFRPRRFLNKKAAIRASRTLARRALGNPLSRSSIA